MSHVVDHNLANATFSAWESCGQGKSPINVLGFLLSARLTLQELRSIASIRIYMSSAAPRR